MPSFAPADADLRRRDVVRQQPALRDVRRGLELSCLACTTLGAGPHHRRRRKRRRGELYMEGRTARARPTDAVDTEGLDDAIRTRTAKAPLSLGGAEPTGASGISTALPQQLSLFDLLER
jgi:hypothetical protein